MLNSSKLAVVTSGTATLETAIFKVPQVIVYKGPSIVVALAKRFIKVDFIGLANLTVGREIVRELIQQDFTPENIQSELKKFETIEGAAIIDKDYNELLSMIGGEGASKKAARIIIKSIAK